MPAKKVLLVVSSYEPALAASMHRVRMLAWYLRHYGWDFEILSPSISFQQKVWIDPKAHRFFAPNAPVTHAKPMPVTSIVKQFGIRGITWQALLPMYRAGIELLQKGQFDLVFFSTTAFNFFCLGRLWRSKFHVPYVLDFQDPWFRNEMSLATTKHVRKAQIGNLLASLSERFAVSKADGLVSVSTDYLSVLQRRYPKAYAFQKQNTAIIPFGALESDFCRQTLADASRRPLVISYVGAGGVVMERSFSRLCRSLSRLRDTHPQTVELFRIQLAGTDGGWAEGNKKILKGQADILGIGDLVTEDPRIIPYSDATAIASAADGLLVLGVDEPAYMASKLFSYASLNKPLLACIHRESQMKPYFQRHPELGTVIYFAEAQESEEEEDAKVLDFLNQILARYQPDRTKVLEEYSADAMSQKLAQLFNKCAADSTPA